MNKNPVAKELRTPKYKSKKVESKITHISGLEFVQQQPQNGTGHAIQQLIPLLKEFTGDLLVLNGDVPLLKEETIKKLISRHNSTSPDVSLLSATFSLAF